MKVKELKHGQYFKYNEHLLCRIICEDIAFFNSHWSISVEPLISWIDFNVTPLEFNEFVLHLTQECIKNNIIVGPITNTYVHANTLLPNTFFKFKDKIGFIYAPHTACYLTDCASGIWDCTDGLNEVIPLTMHQAALLLVQQIAK